LNCDIALVQEIFSEEKHALTVGWLNNTAYRCRSSVFDLHEGEGLGSKIQSKTAPPELRLRALLTDGAPEMELSLR
jgi:hypothetical protein